MTPDTRFSNRRRVHIAAVTPMEQRKRVHDIVARRAFQICQSRGGPGNASEDWRRAESEICRPLTCGFLVLDDRIQLTTNLRRFTNTEIEICVEPRRLTICGIEPATKTQCGNGSSRRIPIAICRSVDLPEEIDPSLVTAKFKGGSLEIDLPRVGARANFAAKAKAA